MLTSCKTWTDGGGDKDEGQKAVNTLLQGLGYGLRMALGATQGQSFG
jgi:hypothetical protein